MSKKRFYCAFLGIFLLIGSYGLLGLVIGEYVNDNDMLCSESIRLNNMTRNLGVVVLMTDADGNFSIKRNDTLFEKVTEWSRTEKDSKNSLYDQNTPSRFRFLVDAEYINQSRSSFNEQGEEDNLLTKTSVSSYLHHYAHRQGLEFFGRDSCLFDDISDKTPFQRAIITDVCKFRLIRGSGRKFNPDSYITQADVLVVLMRSKYGYLNEENNPWYLDYYNKAVELGIVKGGIDLQLLSEGVVISDLALRLEMFESHK